MQKEADIIKLSQKCNEWKGANNMNGNLLKAKIAERGETQGSVAKAVGMSPNSLNRKIGGKRDFTLGEVNRLCDYLQIQNPADIFLSRSSQKCND